MAIKCCKDCKPPERYPGCSDHCEKYKQEKEYHTKEQQWLKANTAHPVRGCDMLGNYPMSPYIIAARRRRK